METYEDKTVDQEGEWIPITKDRQDCCNSLKEENSAPEIEISIDIGSDGETLDVKVTGTHTCGMAPQILVHIKISDDWELNVRTPRQARGLDIEHTFEPD